MNKKEATPQPRKNKLTMLDTFIHDEVFINLLFKMIHVRTIAQKGAIPPHKTRVNIFGINCTIMNNKLIIK